MVSAKTIPPGGEGKIEVKYNTGAKVGKKTQTITVYSDDPEQKTVRLKVRVDIHALLATDPQRLIFGKLKKGNQYPVKYISLIGADKDKTEIVSVQSNNKLIKVESGAFKTGDNKEAQIKVTLLPEIGFGKFTDRINIKTTHKKVKELSLYVSGEVTGDITISRNHVSFGLFKRGVKNEKYVRLNAVAGTSFHVTGVVSTSPGLLTQIITVKEGSSYTIKASIKEDFEGDSLNGKIIISTDNRDQKNITIDVFGKVLKERKLTKAPN